VARRVFELRRARKARRFSLWNPVSLESAITLIKCAASPNSPRHPVNLAIAYNRPQHAQGVPWPPNSSCLSPSSFRDESECSHARESARISFAAAPTRRATAQTRAYRSRVEKPKVSGALNGARSVVQSRLDLAGAVQSAGPLARYVRRNVGGIGGGDVVRTKLIFQNFL
jgi:hypothetical protein